MLPPRMSCRPACDGFGAGRLHTFKRRGPHECPPENRDSALAPRRASDRPPDGVVRPRDDEQAAGPRGGAGVLDSGQRAGADSGIGAKEDFVAGGGVEACHEPSPYFFLAAGGWIPSIVIRDSVGIFMCVDGPEAFTT